MSVLWRIELFGGVRIAGEGRVVDRFRTRKVALLLAHLAHRADRSYSREQLMDRLWPECDLESGRNNLRVALSSLRRQLEPPGIPSGRVLVADRSRVGLNFEAVGADVHEFQRRLHAAESLASPRDRARALREAVELRKGPFLSGHYEDWVLSEEDRLAGLYLSALRQLVPILERGGDHDGAIEYARRAVEADPYSEEAHHVLIHLYRATGRTSLAVRQQEAMERSLDDESGRPPSGVTRSIIDEVNRRSAGAFRPELLILPESPPATPDSPAAGTLTFLLVEVPPSPADSEGTGPESAAITVLRSGGADRVLVLEGRVIGGFRRATDALSCAKAVAASAGEGDGRALRMALDTREVAEERELPPAALEALLTLLDAANAGQALCSERAAPLLALDVDTGAALKDLGLHRLKGGGRFERLYGLEGLGGPAAHEGECLPPRAEMRFDPQLPPQFTRFVGREEEVRHLADLLRPPAPNAPPPSGDRVRLVTLTGPGGGGKTRLSVETAGRLVADYGGAVWLVQLADVRDASLVPDAVMQGMRLRRSPGREPLDQIAERLSVGPSLLILDNFEQLVEEGAVFVRALLERSPSLTCLVSSRQLLGLLGEREFSVRPLPPPRGGESLEELAGLACIRLFLDRAQAVRPDFQLTPGNAESVAELCRRLEGLPLAIELAAARVTALSPAQMLGQLKDRFQFLTSRKRDRAERHRSMRAAVDWSYGLLPPELRRFFTRLSVFRGGWGLQSATEVCEEPNALEYLEQLLECSLIQRESVPPMPVCDFVRPEPDTWLVETMRPGEEEEVRFTMLETIREYGLERLEESGEAERMRLLHLNFYRAWTEFAMWRLGGRWPEMWMRWLNAELENMRAALKWGLANAPRTALRMAGNMGGFWTLRGGDREGLEWLDRALAGTEREVGTPRLRALWQAGNLALGPGEYERARAFLEEALEISRELRDEGHLTAVLGDLGDIALQQGDLPTARTYYEEALGLNVRILARGGMALVNTAHTHLRLGRVEALRKDWDRAGEHFLKSMDFYEQDGGRIGHAHARIEYAAVLRAVGDREGARAHLEASLAVLNESGDRPGLSSAYMGWGDLMRAESLLEDALRYYRDALVLLKELGHRKKIADGLERVALTEGERGRAERAARLLGAALSLREALRLPTGPEDVEGHDRVTAAARCSLGQGYDAAFRAGRAWDWEQAVAYALA